MEMFEDPDYVDARVVHLQRWADANSIKWTEVQAKHNKYRASRIIDGETRLVGLGKTLKQCLWMAYKLETTQHK